MCSVMPSTWRNISLLVGVVCILRGCEAIQCYQCGEGVAPNALPCDLFSSSPTWRQFQVECPASPAHVCGKTVTYEYYDDEEFVASETRGCAPAEDRSQVPNTIGCGENHDSGSIFCLCDTDLCNSASIPLPSFTLAIPLSLALFSII